MNRPLNLKEAAEYLGCSTYTLADKARSKEIRGVKCGGWKFMEQDLVDYVRGTTTLIKPVFGGDEEI